MKNLLFSLLIILTATITAQTTSAFNSLKVIDSTLEKDKSTIYEVNLEGDVDFNSSIDFITMDFKDVDRNQTVKDVFNLEEELIYKNINNLYITEGVYSNSTNDLYFIVTFSENKNNIDALAVRKNNSKYILLFTYNNLDEFSFNNKL